MSHKTWASMLILVVLAVCMVSCSKKAQDKKSPEKEPEARKPVSVSPERPTPKVREVAPPVRDGALAKATELGMAGVTHIRLTQTSGAVSPQFAWSREYDFQVDAAQHKLACNFLVRRYSPPSMKRSKVSLSEASHKELARLLPLTKLTPNRGPGPKPRVGGGVTTLNVVIKGRTISVSLPGFTTRGTHTVPDPKLRADWVKLISGLRDECTKGLKAHRPR